jgi:hypothetical protein
VKFQDGDADQTRIGPFFVARIDVREDKREGLASLVAELRWGKDQTAKRRDAEPS